MTVTGKTLAENLADCRTCKQGSSHPPLEEPVLPRGHIRNPPRQPRARRARCAKITGKEGERFAGRAKVYDSEEAMLRGSSKGENREGQRGGDPLRGAKGGPGHAGNADADLGDHGRRLGADVALLTDGGSTGGSHGFIIGHITPEAPGTAGPSPSSRKATASRSMPAACSLSMDVSDEELASRRKQMASRPS
jgi:dihydroxy-acid dehydratase